eukprot:jgi/Mesvir1/6759/Mv16720-RA.1
MASAATVSSPNPRTAAKVRAAKRPRHEEEFEKNERAAHKLFRRMFLSSERHLAPMTGCNGQLKMYVSAPVTPGCPTLEVGAQLGMLESSLNDRIRVRALPANDPHGPFGAFAGRDFAAGDEIGVYGGALVRYYRLPDGDLDTSSAQNCEFKTPNDALLSSRVYALRDIREGEELLINYGDSYFNQAPDTVDAPAQPPVPKRPRTARRQESSASSAPTSVQTARVSVPSSSIPYALPVQSVPSALPAPSALPDFSARIGDWRAFGPQTQRVVAALVKDTTCVLVGKRYEDSRGNCVEKVPELKPRLGRPEEWLAQPDGPTSAPVFTRCVAIGRTIGLVPLRDFPSTPLAYMPSVDDLNECGLGRARHGSVILETETAADGSQWVRAVALVKTTIARPTVASYHARGLTPAQLLLAARSC